MTSSHLRTLDGRPVVLGKRLGRGGEGAVHLIANAPGYAVKVYHEYDARRSARLSAALRTDYAHSVPAVAWPRRLVMDQEGRKVGFIMEAYPDARPVHDLYTPLSRRIHFPNVGWPFLVRAALNLARVVARLHADGIVIGDLNHSSVMVLPVATVRLVDADSFPHPPDCVCLVGTPEYLPAELQRADLAVARRRPRHDVFALSVLVYQLLFDGRHPFAGYGGRPSPNVADNIRRVRRYVLGDRERSILARRFGPELGNTIGAVLCAAFARKGCNDDGARRWVEVLAGGA